MKTVWKEKKKGGEKIISKRGEELFIFHKGGVNENSPLRL